MSDTAATWDFPTFTVGDTFLARDIATLTQNAAPLTVYKAVMELRKKNNDLIYRWATHDSPVTATITGVSSNTVTLSKVEEAVTALWPVGVHVYDLEIWLDTNTDKITILKGEMRIERGVTSNTV